MNDLELLTEIIVALIFLHALVDFFFDVRPLFKNSSFRLQKIQKLCRSGRRRKLLQDRLLIPRLGDQIARRKVTGGSQIADRIEKHPEFL